MSLFSKQLAQTSEFLSEKREGVRVREYQAQDAPDWPYESSLILEDQTALELGNPSQGSMLLIMWSEQKDAVRDDLITLIGPEMSELGGGSAPLGLVLLVSGSFGDEYETYRMLKDAVYDIQLEGLMIRAVASRQTIWCRVNREALDKGLSLNVLGAELIWQLKQLDNVTAAEAIIVTSGKEDLERLKAPAYEAGRIIGAMMKMNEEMDFDCDTCDYREVCYGIEELKRIRRRLQGEQTG